MNNFMTLLINIGPIILMFIIFYFLLIVPEKKRKKKYQSMVDELKVNDEIVTRGGIIGKISHIDDKSVTIVTSSAKTKIKLDNSGIAYKATNE